MAQHKSYVYKGFGEEARKSHGFSQAVRVGDNIHIAGQGGWNPKTSVIHENRGDQIDQAFANVDLILKTAGSEGWSQVYRVNSFHIQLDDKEQDMMVQNFRKYAPDQNFTWTCVEVSRLGAEDMKVEIEVSAYDPKQERAAVNSM